MKEEVISHDDLASLPEYSYSVPTGVTIGKRWRCAKYDDNREPIDWAIGEYVESSEPHFADIKWVWAVSEPGSVHRGRL